MHWIEENVIALVALVLSLATGSVQLWTAWRNRHRIIATGQQLHQGGAGDEPGRDLAHIRVRSVGRAVGVERITLEWLDNPPVTYNGLRAWSYHSARPPVLPAHWRPGDVVDAASILDEARLVADGAIESWISSVNTFVKDAATDPHHYRGQVWLTSGRTVQTNTFIMRPTYI